MILFLNIYFDLLSKVQWTGNWKIENENENGICKVSPNI